MHPRRHQNVQQNLDLFSRMVSPWRVGSVYSAFSVCVFHINNSVQATFGKYDLCWKILSCSWHILCRYFWKLHVNRSFPKWKLRRLLPWIVIAYYIQNNVTVLGTGSMRHFPHLIYFFISRFLILFLIFFFPVLSFFKQFFLIKFCRYRRFSFSCSFLISKLSQQ